MACIQKPFQLQPEVELDVSDTALNATSGKNYAVGATNYQLYSVFVPRGAQSAAPVCVVQATPAMTTLVFAQSVIDHLKT